MTDALAPLVRQLFLNPSTGAPASGFKVFQYAAGTTTKLATFTDSTGATPNTNPILLDSLGECDIWIPVGVSYKFVFSPPTDTDPPTNPVWTRDNISSGLTQLSGVFTPTDASGAGLSFTSATGSYVRIGSMVYVAMTVIYPTTANGANAAIGGLPFVADPTFDRQFLSFSLTTSNITVPSAGRLVPNTQTMTINNIGNGAPAIVNSTLSATENQFVGWYKAL